MAFKSILLFSLVIVAMVAPIADSQLLGGLLGLTSITGIVPCSLGGTITVNGTAAPGFPNALVQLQCGSGNVVSSTTTNGAGIFSMVLNPLQVLLQDLLTGCVMVVKTPLVSCNAALPSVGGLLSPLKFIETTIQGLLSIANVGPLGFTFLQNLP